MVRKDRVTEEMKRLMSEADRQKLGLSISASGLGHPPSYDSGTKRDYLTRKEEQEHTHLINQLNQWELFFRHARMDKPTTEAKGLPDFIIGICGRMVCIEFKLPGKTLTPAQEEWRRRAIEKSHVLYYVFNDAGNAIQMLSEMRHLLSGNT
jgi:hypothetical protein